MITYKWKSSARLGAHDPQVIGERIEVLRKEHSGGITAQDLVDDGKRKRSPFYPLFEWDDTVAGAKYRLEQARHVLRVIQIVKPNAPTIRAFHVVDVKGRRAYTSIQRVMSVKALRQQVLQRAYDELQDWHKRYQDLEEFAKVFGGISAAIQGIKISGIKKRP